MEATAPLPAPKREPRKRIPSDLRRESILDTAVAAFAEGGYDRIRTQDLAATAGISEALIYQHFRTKAELYSEAMRRSAERLEAKLAEATSAGPPAGERLERGLEAFLVFVADKKNAWPLLTMQVSEPEVSALQRELRSRAIGDLADLLALDPRAHASGLKKRQLEQLAEIIAGGAEALAAWWSANPKANRSELVDLLTGFVWSGLERTYGGSAKK